MKIELESQENPSIFYVVSYLKNGVWEEILGSLLVTRRLQAGREASPSLLAIDSQSVKAVQFVSEATGIDGNKKINGRKPTIFVDRLGLSFAMKVTAANVSDNEVGLLALEILKGKVPRIKKIAADGAYFIPEKKRWQVERAPSWLNFRRRLFKEIEKTVESAEAMLQIASI